MTETIFGGELIRHEKGKLIFIILIFAILAMNTVSAAENPIQSEDSVNDLNNDDINLLVNDEENSNHAIIIANEEENSLDDADDGFEYIQKLIDNAKDGDSIYLENKTYKGNGTSINVNKNLNIYGYRYTENTNTILDANSKSNAFIIDPNIHLNLYGLKIINGNNYNGGAITNRGTLNIFNSLFENNAGTYGGAIYNSNYLSIENSSFNRNSAFDAGAIYNSANLTISNSNFTSQKVSHKAGVIFSSKYLDIENAIFKLTKGADEGGAIFASDGVINIKSSKFLTNNAISYGGAIDNSGKMTIENSEFNANSAYGAGAIDNGGELTIINSLFAKNKATVNGGAIDTNNILMIIGSVFENNSAKGNGGAIIARKNTTVSHCSFLNNPDSSGYEVFSNEENISLDNNWWGLNNPKFEDLLNIAIENDFKWIIMNFTNQTPLKQNQGSNLIISFNQTIDKNNNYFDLEDHYKLANLKGNIILEGPDGKTIYRANITNGTLLKSFDLRLEKNISAIIDNQIITLNISETDASEDNGEDEENRTSDNNASAEESNINNETSDDFNKTEDFNLNEFKIYDFTKSIHSKSVNSNLDRSSNKEINDKNGEKYKEDIDYSSSNLIYLIPIAIIALLILIAFKRKHEEDDEN